MAKLLYIETSPRKQRSASIEVARAFLDAYRQAHPGESIQEIDVWSLDLPEFEDAAFEAKYAGIEGRERKPAQKALLVLAKGVDYSAGSPSAPWDQQTPYLKVWLNSIGITDITVLPVEKNLYGPEADRASREAAMADGRALATSF